VTRSVSNAISGKEIWQGTGNKESFKGTFFSKDSVVWWLITNFKRIRNRYESALADPNYSHIKFVRLRSRREQADYLAGL
jgi:hypothetical protein